MNEYPGLEFSASEGSLRVAIQPHPDRPALDVDRLRGLLHEAGYGDWFLFEEALTLLVERYNLPVDEFEVLAAERLDGSFSLEFSADAMLAWVNLVPPYGGKSVTSEEVFTALDEAGVIFGINQAAVNTLCLSGQPARVTVATAVAAENGEDTRFDLLVAEARDRAPQVDENGLINFRELGAIPLVVADQPLMRRVLPTNGIHGRTIHGELIEALPGSDVAFAENLVGAYAAKDDGNLLRAVFSGQPVLCGNGVRVEHVLHVRDVNIASGNMSFNGTVHVTGDVLPGMKVHATGDVVVTGVVDGGELDAGGDIHVAGGIIAHAKVRAGGAVAARFVESSQIQAGTAIAIDDTALQSDLQAINQIVVGIKSTQRGRLAGGSARAMLLVAVPVLGAATGGVTSIQLGGNSLLEAKYRDLLEQIEKHKADEANLKKVVTHLSTHADKGNLLERAKASWQQAVQAWARLLPEKDDLERQRALMSGARLQVGVSVSGAVDISFGKKTARVLQGFDGGAFSVMGERVVFTDRGGHVKALG